MIPASTDSAANQLARQDSTGKLKSVLGGSASSLATLNPSTKVVEDPASAQAAGGNAKIPLGDANGRLAASWGGTGGGSTPSVLAALDASGQVPALAAPAKAVYQNGGGQQLSLDTLQVPQADVAWNSKKITGLLDPTQAQDAATKAYVDATKQGLDIKDSVRVASNAALPAYTRAGNVITMSAVGVVTVDGVAIVLNDRILLKDGAAGADNGIYKCTTEGTASVAAVFTRAIDADSDLKVTAGMYTFADQGTANADSGWVLTTNDPITLNTTVLSFTQFSGAGQITAGSGLTKSGNTINFSSAAPSADDGLVITSDDVVVDWETVAGNYSTINGGDAASVGAQGKAARSDHQHPVATAAPGATNTTGRVAAGNVAAEGVSTSLARADHVHPMENGTLGADVTVAAGLEGIATSVARGDHTHRHPIFSGNDLHSEYIQASGARDFTGAVKSAGRKLTVQNIAASASISATADVARLDGASAAVDGTLPAATGSGRAIRVNTISVANATRVVPQAGDAIDGAANGAAKSLVAAFEGYLFVDVAANKWNTF